MVGFNGYNHGHYIFIHEQKDNGDLGVDTVRQLIYIHFARFMLQYSSRDAVEIYKQGAGGVGEFRTELVNYTIKSPLFGFLLYRRRKVLIRYVPDGTSRLLQGMGHG